MINLEVDYMKDISICPYCGKEMDSIGKGQRLPLTVVFKRHKINQSL